MSPSSLSVPICHLVPFTVSVLALAFFPVSTCARAPFQCPHVPGHYSSGHMCPGTLPVRKSARATFRCSYVTGNYSGANICPGSLPAPICAWTPFGAYVFLCSILVPICFRAPIRCLYVPGHSYGAHSCLGTFRCPYVPGHHSGAHMCPGTIPVPIGAREPFW